MLEIRGNKTEILLQISGNKTKILLQISGNKAEILSQISGNQKVAEVSGLRYFVCFKYLVVKVSRNLTYLYYHLHGFLHCLHADKLVRSVEVAAAGEDVRTWQTLE